MKLSLRKLLTVLAAGSLLSLFLTSSATAAALDDGYPEGSAAPGRTCSADAVGQKELSSYSGKNLSCILIYGIAKWWIDGDPLPAVETPAAKPTASAEPTPSNVPTSAGNQFVLEKGVKITLIPRFFASSITVKRVIPFKKQSGSGVWSSPFFITKNKLAPVASAKKPR